MAKGWYDGGKYDSYSGGQSSLFGGEKCYKSHPALKMGQFAIYGGNCAAPSVTDADVYIGFDYELHRKPPFPWEVKEGPVLVHFKIPDMGVPSDPEQFKKLVAWTCAQVKQGLKVHAGCIGGHGRTGMFLAAVYREMTGEEDAITKVRELYCTKAVESSSQVKFLAQHFGIKAVKGAKEFDPPSSFKGEVTSKHAPSNQTKVKSGGSGGSGSTWGGKSSLRISAMPSTKDLWRETT